MHLGPVSKRKEHPPLWAWTTRVRIQFADHILLMEVRTFSSCAIILNSNFVGYRSMLTFILSILHTCFFHTSSLVRIATGVTFAFLTLVIVIILYVDWGVNPFTHPNIRGTILGTLRERIPLMPALIRVSWRKNRHDVPVWSLSFWSELFHCTTINLNWVICI